MRIELTDAELMVCQTLGSLRSLVNRRHGVADAKMGDQSGMNADIDGLIGEYAFCKAYNLFCDIAPTPRSGSFDAVTRKKMRIDVKATRRKDGRLLATLKSNPDVDAYVLAIIDGNSVELAGWMKREELCTEGNIRSLGHGDTYVMDRAGLRGMVAP